MVKSYSRYEHSGAFGLISSTSNVVYIGGGSAGGSSRVLTAGLEEILLWNVKTGELIMKLRDGVEVGSYESKTLSAPAVVTCLQYHEQTNIVAAGYSDGCVKIWDLSSGSVLIVFTGHTSGVTELIFDRSGTRLCSGSKDSTMIMWDLVGEVGLFKLKGHKDQITGLKLVGEDGGNVDEMEDWLISTSKDGLIKLWDLRLKICVETHVAHSGECWSFDYDPQSQVAITSGMENQLKVWHVDLKQENEQVAKLVEKGVYLKQSNSRATNIEFVHLSGSLVFFLCQNSDKTVELFRIRTAEEISKAVARKMRKLAEKFSQDQISQQIESGKINMLIHPITTVRSMAKVKSATWGHCSAKCLDIVFSSNNNSIEYHSVKLPSQVRKISVTNSEIQPVKKHSIDLLGHRSDIRSLDISHDNKLLATASNGQLKIWNIRSRNCLRTIECGYSLSCKFLPGDSLVIVGTWSGGLQLFDLASSELLHEVPDAHSNSIWSLDLTNDGKTLVTGSADKCVKYWTFKVELEYVPGTKTTVAKMKLFHSKTLELDEDILAVKISPVDNKFLAVSLLDNTVKVFHFDSLKFYLSLYGHKLPVLSIDISYDSKLIVTSSADKNIKIWGLDFGDCHKSIFAHQDSIMNVRFLPESHNFFSAAKDGVVKYWDGDKFEAIQKLAAHQSEIWALAVANSGEFVITASHDHSIRIWKETSDEVFLQEEKEKEIDELYEQTLLESLEADELGIEKAINGELQQDQGETDQVEAVNKQTLESLKDGEKIMAALDVGVEDLKTQQEYQAQLLAHHHDNSQAPIKPDRNVILQAKNISAVEYVFQVTSSIKASHLEDAILILPFSYSMKLLQFLNYWTSEKKYLLNNLSLICKLLFFIIRIHHKELVNTKDGILKLQLVKVKDQLRAEMKKINTDLGYNIQGLKYMKDQWNLKHNNEYVDEYQQVASDEKNAQKRAYEKVV